MGNDETPKPSLLHRIWKAIRSLWHEQGNLTERRNANRAEQGKYGTGM